MLALKPLPAENTINRRQSTVTRELVKVKKEKLTRKHGSEWIREVQDLLEN